ncbi:MAG TPA: L-histidine N(alpha)-methyltransferase [Acidimicrobiales bacterium]|nr:L-histidine N(alpha)-methyltransferase [Acidimicrobiales bacterium]
MTAIALSPHCSIEVHLGPDDLADALRRDVLDGLTADPKRLPPKWFYDEAGSALFDQITRLEEYYPTRRETEILVREADAIARRTRATTLLELGSGTSTKTHLLLGALAGAGSLERIVAFDVCEPVLRAAGPELATRYPGVRVEAIVGDFERHLGRLPMEGTSVVAFLGGTIGNLAPVERAKFLGELVDQLQSGDWLLLGTDLVKDPDRLVRAYDDDRGVTAEFNRNVLRVLNRELAGDLVPERFGHVARWDPDEQWIEMHLRSEGHQRARLGALDLDLRFDGGELLHTEISAKFTRGRLEGELAAAGLELDRLLTDAAGDFALTLSRKP